MYKEERRKFKNLKDKVRELEIEVHRLQMEVARLQVPVYRDYEYYPPYPNPIWKLDDCIVRPSQEPTLICG